MVFGLLAKKICLKIFHFLNKMIFFNKKLFKYKLDCFLWVFNYKDKGKLCLHLATITKNTFQLKTITLSTVTEQSYLPWDPRTTYDDIARKDLPSNSLHSLHKYGLHDQFYIDIGHQTVMKCCFMMNNLSQNMQLWFNKTDTRTISNILNKN